MINCLLLEMIHALDHDEYFCDEQHHGPHVGGTQMFQDHLAPLMLNCPAKKNLVRKHARCSFFEGNCKPFHPSLLCGIHFLSLPKFLDFAYTHCIRAIFEDVKKTEFPVMPRHVLWQFIIRHLAHLAHCFVPQPIQRLKVCIFKILRGPTHAILSSITLSSR